LLPGFKIDNITLMSFSPGQQVIVLDTMHKPAGSAVVQVYHAESQWYTVLFQYPGSSVPESIPIPEYRLLMPPLVAISNAPWI
jgi:hypothetical protein